MIAALSPGTALAAPGYPPRRNRLLLRLEGAALGTGALFPGSFDRTHLGPIGRAARGGGAGA